MSLQDQSGLEHVVLVDEDGRLGGAHEKQDAHLRGLLHRAFSVLLVNDHAEVLLQKRSAGKYHCAGLWSNTCCGHPRLNERVETAAERRLYEELGLRARLSLFNEFQYRLPMPNGLIEHEFVSLYLGCSHDTPTLNPLEVSDVQWLSFDGLRSAILEEPETFTPWFRLYMDRYGADIGAAVHERC